MTTENENPFDTITQLLREVRESNLPEIQKSGLEKNLRATMRDIDQTIKGINKPKPPSKPKPIKASITAPIILLPTMKATYIAIVELDECLSGMIEELGKGITPKGQFILINDKLIKLLKTMSRVNKQSKELYSLSMASHHGVPPNSQNK
jgi:hypothetical protein